MLLCAVLPTDGDVFIDGPGKEHGRLCHQTDFAAKPRQIVVCQGLAVNQDRAALRRKGGKQKRKMNLLTRKAHAAFIK